ncbi:MAG TPA: DPP IV N-terminal domain-containing protein, partial [Blastocatellia bacterium]
DFFDVNPSKPAWSPDGKIIACAAGTATKAGNKVNVVEVRAEDGTEKPISSSSWPWIKGLAWLADGSGLVMTALEHQERMLGSTRNFQIWHLSYPSGEARKITNDSNEYTGISITADSNIIVTTQYDDLGNVWTAPDGDANRAKQITTGASKYFGVSWTTDGRIVYCSIASGDPDIWIADGDGSNQKQLSADARANANPSVSHDGRYIIFESSRTGARNIWRMDIDGRNPKQLTSGAGELFPQCSPDGKWIVYYSSEFPNKPTLWKVPIDGGEPVQVTDEFSVLPTISPDGKLIAYFYRDERIIPARGIAVIPFEGGQPIKRFEISATAYAWTRWTPDGRGLTYIDTRGGVSNLWTQPLDGGRPKQLTEFKDGRMFWFDWSRDGKQLAFVRVVVSNDVVLISSIR